MKISLVRWACLTLLTAAGIFSLEPAIRASSAPQLPFTGLYTFTNGNDGALPVAGLVQGSDGGFYGTSSSGGASSNGTLFKISTNGAFTSLYLFTGGNDGANPLGPLVQGLDGSLYGTASAGGSNSHGGIFRVTTNGTLTNLYSFTGGNDGATPKSALVQGVDGSLYGTTSAGGTNSDGTVFAIGTNGGLTRLHSFAGTDGANPNGPLVQAGDGSLYGSTAAGGNGGVGTVFRISTNGAFSSLYSFTNGSDGSTPIGGLIFGSDGNLYGSVSLGGASNDGGIFKITTNGALSLIYTFSGTNDGAAPLAGLIQTLDGNLYGTASSGGAFDDGAVFEISTNGALVAEWPFMNGTDGKEPAASLALGRDGYLYGTAEVGGSGHGTVFRVAMPAPSFTNLYSFSRVNDGYHPESGMTLGTDGNLYGTTYQGGTNGGYGTIYQMTTNGVLTSLYSFSDGADGMEPVGTLAQGTDGYFYGTAFGGGTNSAGTVFKVGTNGAFTPLYSFAGSNDGASPGSGLVLGGDGNFYGTTENFGATNGRGTVFKITSNGVLTTLYVFTNGVDGAKPTGALVQSNGLFYGTANAGGTNGAGTFYSISTNGVFHSLYSFKNGSDGGSPVGGLVAGSDGYFYGTAALGGFFNGTIFKVNTNGTLTGVHSFNGTDGSNPQGGLILGSDGSFYGTTYYGGNYGYGNVFRLTAGTVTSYFSFTNSTDGSLPQGSLCQAGSGLLYGITYAGGTNGVGTTYQIGTNGGFTALQSFTAGHDGNAPECTLVESSSGVFYGTTLDGGTNGNFGTVFSMTTNGTVTSLYSFTGSADGANPNAGLILATDGNLYGTTALGTTNQAGTVFRITTNGVLTSIYTFTNGYDGGDCESSLLQASDGFLYGTAHSGGGGTNFSGTIFKISTNGVLTHLYSFTNGIDGANPEGELIQGSDGNLYGTAYSGGASTNGTVFKISTNGAFTALHSFTGTDGANPEAGLVFGTDGYLYGATLAGGPGGFGTVFKISTNGALTSLYAFKGSYDGSEPKCTLIPSPDGGFFGTTIASGANGKGVVFKIMTNGLFTCVHYFNPVTDGASPEATLLQGSDGNYYATAALGGAAGMGTVFRLGGQYFEEGLTGSLQVTLSPAGAAATGQWEVDDSGVFYNSGATVSGLSVGLHEVCFSSASNFTAPECQIVSVTTTGTAMLTGTYVTNFTVSVSASPIGAGTVGGGGAFTSNDTVTVTAAASTGYAFGNWSVSGAIVSTSTNYSFTVTSNTALVANFTLTAPLIAVSYGPNPGTAITNGQATAIDFGSVEQGFSGTTITFTITNGGASNLSLGPLSVPSGYDIVTNTPAFIAPGASAPFVLQLNTAAVGTFAGTVSFTNNGLNTSSPFAFPVTGIVTAPPPPMLAVTYGTNPPIAITNGQTNVIDFGSVEYGQTGPTITFALTNAGASNLILGVLSVPSGFSIPLNLPAFIPPGSNASFIVQLDSTDVGTNAGSITFSNNASNTTSPFSFPVQGIVTPLPPPLLAVTYGTNPPIAITNGQTNVINFGSVEYGQTGPTITFALTNSGASNLILGVLSVPSGFSIPLNLPEFIPPGSNASFIVQLDSTDVGTNAGSITFSNNASNTTSPFSFPVQGIVTPLPPPLLAVTYGTNPPIVITNGQTNVINYGSVEYGQTGPTITFALTNSGASNLILGVLSVPSGFSIPLNLPEFIPPGSNASFIVQLDSTDVGTNAGSITFSNNASNTTSPFSFPVQGIVTPLPPPLLAVTYGTNPPIAITNGQTNVIDYGSVEYGQTGPTITFALTNSGASNLILGVLSVPSGFSIPLNLPEFIPPGSNASFIVQLDSTDVGTNAGSITFSNNASNTTSPFSFPVQGIVTPLPPPLLTVTYGTNPPIAITNGQTNVINFGSVELNQTGPVIIFDITNTGGSNLLLGGVVNLPAGFSAPVNPPTLLAPGSNAQFEIELNTTNVGVYAGSASFTHNASNTSSPFSFSISGTVLAPPSMQVFNGATLVTNGQTNPASAISFGTVGQGSNGPAITFTITNSGGVTLTVAQPVVPAGYAVVSNPPASIAAGSNGSFTVQLSTTAPGVFTGDISLTNNDPTNSPYVFAVTGTVEAPPQIEILVGGSPVTGPVDFGNVPLGSNGTIKVFTITNTGGQTLAVGTPVMPSGFNLTTNPPASIAAGASGTFAVQLTNTPANTYSGNVTISNNSATNPAIIAVIGAVTPPGPEIQVWQGTNLVTDNQTNVISLGSALQNEVGPVLTFTVSNIGAQSLSVSNITVPAGFILATNLTNAVGAGSNGLFAVQLDTTLAGTNSGQIVITNNDPLHNPYAFPVSGAVLSRVLVVSGSLDFGVVPLGLTSNLTLTLSNAGNSDLAISNISYTFSNEISGTPSLTNPLVLAAQATQSIVVSFKPDAPTNFSGQATIVSDATSGATNLVPITAFGANAGGDALLLTLITNGNGAITPNDAKIIKLGTPIVLHATAKGQDVFAGWTGSITSTNNPLKFVMSNSMTIEADFIPNPYLPYVGTYNGLFWASNNIITATNAGLLKALALTSKGSYSATLSVDGVTKPFTGSFSTGLQASKTIVLGKTQGTVAVDMTLTSNDVAPYLTGTISNSTLNWVSTNLIAYRATNDNNVSPNYTLALWPDTNVIVSPGGYGYALIAAKAGTAKTAGTATITGSLADGTAFSQSTSISADGVVPVYASLYAGKGLVLGWINLNPTNGSGPLYWVHPVVTTRNALVPGPFVATNQIAFAPWTNSATFTLTNLAEFDGMETNAVTNLSVNITGTGVVNGTGASVNIAAKTGQLTVTIGSGAAKVTGHGVIVLDGTNTAGYGYFLTKTNGAIILTR